jgi:hypothetical protein
MEKLGGIDGCKDGVVVEVGCVEGTADGKEDGCIVRLGADD